MKTVERYSIEEAFKALNRKKQINEEQTYVIRNGKKVKKNYKGGFEGLGFEDLFDQVYCTLTHGGDLGADRRILGDLGRKEIKYNDDRVSIDYSDANYPRICIVDTEKRLQNAKTVAQIYNLEYEVRPFGRGLSKIYIYVPADEPVDHTVFHYVDANNELIDLVNVADTEEDKVPVLASAESDSNKTSIAEDVQSSMPATVLSSSEIHNFVDALPVATGTRPPQPFKLGYIREMRAEIPAKYKGGRGSQDQPFVRIFKASEYSKLYTKAAYESLGSTKAYRKETGKEAGGERTGFHSTDAEAGNILNAIGSYPNGDLALQAYPMSDNKIKVAYFISFDDGDLVRTTKEEVANYLTPAAASKLLGTRDAEAEVSRGADNINRFKLSGIYMIGNLGHSII